MRVSGYLVASFVLAIAIVMAPEAMALPLVVWGDAAGPWATGPSGTTNGSGGSDATAIANSFRVTGAVTPVQLRWTYWGSGWFVGVGDLWDLARLELHGLGWIAPGNSANDPWDVSNATLLWEHSETLGPAPGPDTPFGGSFGPLEGLFVVQPEVTYTLKQWNLSTLNFFDLGYFSATITSDPVAPVATVPEPSGFMLLLAGVGVYALQRTRRSRK
jgi:hypothetical protein